jgi:hypothetical protein
MSFNYAITTAQEILHKPIEIKNVVVGVKHLKEGGIITSDTANAVINLIFTDITTEVDAAGFIAAAEAVQQNVHNYSGYLYKTTDELTAEMHSGPSLTDVTHVNTIRGVLNDVFDKMSAGYNQSASVAMDIAALKTDFYATPANTATYWANWELYETSFPYDFARMDAIYNNIMSANNTHYNYMSMLADLIDDYPHINIEQDPMTRVARKLAPGTWWIVATNSSAAPELRIHPDDGTGSDYNPDISYAIAPQTLILQQISGAYRFGYKDTVGAGVLNYHDNSDSANAPTPGNLIGTIANGSLSGFIDTTSVNLAHLSVGSSPTFKNLKDYTTTNITGALLFIIK